MAMKTAFVLVGVSALLGGCMIKAQGFNGGGGSGAPGAYSGSECDAVWKPESEQWKSDKKKIDEPTEAQRALAVACDPRKLKTEEYLWGYNRGGDDFGKNLMLVEPLELRDLHHHFEDRKVDAILGALFVIQTATNDQGPSGYVFFDKHHLDEMEKDENEAWRPEYILGLAKLYASMVKPVLAQQLEALQIPADAKAAFTQKFEWSASTIDTLLEPMTAAKKKIFVDLPAKVHADRLAYYEAHAAEYAKLDALEADADKAKGGAGDANAVAASITSLRSDYLKACGGEACTYDPFYVEATKTLTIVYLAAKQPLLAAAEADVLARKDANQHGFAPELDKAQKEVVLRAREAYELKSNAKNKGLDAATTNAVVGDVPAMDFEGGTLWEAPTSLPDLSGLAKGKGVKEDVGTVASIKPKGTTATIDFGTEYDTTSEPYNCVKTGRLEAIHDDGTLQWEENCQYATKKVPREKPAPITVLASDVKGLKSGEHLTFVVETSTRAAVIVDAYKELKDDKRQFTQLRGDRLDGPKVAKKSDTKADAKKAEAKKTATKTAG
jgi:hypothetical protein